MNGGYDELRLQCRFHRYIYLPIDSLSAHTLFDDTLKMPTGWTDEHEQYVATYVLNHMKETPCDSARFLMRHFKYQFDISDLIFQVCQWQGYYRNNKSNLGLSWD